jgi:hydroxymethylglutaryl-CoA synthase
LQLLASRSLKELEQLRYLAVGTETSVDMSKPISSYVGGMLKEAGLAIPATLSSFQVQHACAGGTLAMLSVAGLLLASPVENESGLVICSDIARYEAPSTAEITQGAGAVSILVEKNPKLVEIDISTQGYSSKDVDDFFRPLGSVTAKVRGSYSVQCYQVALDEAFKDHCQRRNKTPKEIIDETDIFVFHVPYVGMAKDALVQLLEDYADYSPKAAVDFLDKNGFKEALESSAQIGNLYTGALYLNLASQLKTQYKMYGKDIVGKKILFSSYGSGNTMVVLSAQIAEDAPSVIESWDLESRLNHDQSASFTQYESWLNLPKDSISLNDKIQREEIPKGVFYLKEIREDGYRSYGISK